MRIFNVLLLGGASLIVAAPTGVMNEETREASISFLESTHYKKSPNAAAEPAPAIEFLDSVHYKRTPEAEAAAEPITVGLEVQFDRGI
ncbi:uncharacterized protein CLUP02_15925 [Colletotrichum lupini]|uniref:Uncharacterized protein n=1 Tax=Colletotrichum lupini TaxID=145971 RepID=A0A9Q8WPN9_9PEZI|nr:uncharacterized protein CLUP02_15925 [Colletotrichum lupini]UQC90395.1 hypothetical protein CLUP02_15925 [Colletotrichum lupini]